MSDPTPDSTRDGKPLLPPDWQEMAPLIDAVLDAAPERRATLIIELCEGNLSRQRALEHLVAECERDTPLLDRVAAERFDGLANEAPDSLLPGLLGDRYRVGRELGRGGMACVYLARDLKHERDVAIKVIRPELSASLGHDRFLREIGIAARLRHPNIVPLYDSGEVAGSLYFVMPYEEGVSLRERLAEAGALPVSDALNVLRDVARALAYAHEHGVVHRDVKPDNVMLSGGAAVVTDFGIAKAVSAALTDVSGPTLTQSGSAIGTPAYMAPEQATGDPSTDHRADIYSFGCLAYELFTGEPPFHNQSMHEVIAAHIATVPRPVTALRADVPPAAAELIARCLEKNPAARPQSARDLLGVLDGAATTGPSVTPPGIAAVRRPARALQWAGLALAAGAIAAAAYLITRSVNGSTPITLSVIPFFNIAADTTVSYLEGLADEVAGALTRVPGIQIRSRNGARAYGGQMVVDPAEAGARLNADYLMTGLIRQDRGRWVLSLDLTRTADATSLWADNFNVNPDEQAGASEAIAGRLVSALRELFPKSIGSVPIVAANQRTSNPEAYRLYLIGKQKLNRRSQNILPSIDLFRDALKLDTLSAEAWSGLSLALALAPRLQQLSPAPFTAEATDAARRALLLNPNLSEPHVALGMLAEYAWQWDLAESEFKTALGLDSHDVEARLQYGTHLRIRDRLAESMRQLQLAREDDPASAPVASHLAYAWYLNGQLDSALAERARAWKIDSTNLTTVTTGAMVLLGAGQKEEARRVILTLPASSVFSFYVLGAAGDRTAVIQRLQALDSTRPVSPRLHTAHALAMFGLGDTARALDALERATNAREMWFWGFGAPSGPILGRVRGSARFKAIQQQVRMTR